eukprot:716324_1
MMTKARLSLSLLSIKDYTLLEIAGAGSFARVFIAIDKVTNKTVAIKQIEKCFLMKSNAHKRTVWCERRMMTAFENPFVMNLDRAFHDDYCCYLVMSYMAGGDLRSYLNKVGKLSEDAVRIYAAQLLLGLEHIHSCKVVYRDLKPENILIDEKGHLVIADFGLSDRLRKSRKNEKLAGRTGTRKYMAPEQLNRQHYNQSVDFWALGILICEMLTGLRPFRQ